MNSILLEQQNQKLLSIIYQIPMGIVETDALGSILQMNAKSVQLLMPLFFSLGLSGNNLNELLAAIAPDVLQNIEQFSQSSGCIYNQAKQEIHSPNTNGESILQYFLFTINKIDTNSFTYVFDDITELHKKEKELNEILKDKAIEQNKFEIASAVLHDIGNAVVGFGSYITRVKRTVEQNEIGTLENLKGFIKKNLPALNTAIGEKKANAIIDLLNGVVSHQIKSQEDLRKSLTEQMMIIGHIQEILNIQRQYVKGQNTDRATVNIRSVINDAVAMLFGIFDKRGITFQLNADAILPGIKGDRTKLMQVFLNLLKNAVDAVSSEKQENKEITVSIIRTNNKLVVEITDNGKGFDTATGKALFTRGYTTKAEGTGLGLVNCKNIIEGHNGEIFITSAGIGKGANISIIFNL